MVDRELLLPFRIGSLAANDPDRVYLRDVNGGFRTYRETHENALRWASLLRAQGVTAGDPVLSLLPTSIVAAELWIGASWLGAVLIPINIEYRGTILRHAVRVSGAQLLVTTGTLLVECNEYPEIVDQLRAAVVIDQPPTTTQIPSVNLATVWPADVPEAHNLSGPTGSDVAVVLFTSGTTGPSKGVTMHWAQIHAGAARYFPPEDFGSSDVYYAPFPLFHLSGLMALVTMALCGGSVVLRERFKTGEFWSDVSEFGCTTTLLLGAMVEFLVSSPPTDQDHETPLDKVCMIPLHPTAKVFGQRFCLRICTNYGSSESGTVLVSDWDPENTRSCGRQRPEYEVTIVDDDDNELPIGAVGECVVRPREPWTSMSAYWNMPEASLRAFRNQYVHTGDLLYRDAEGNFFYVDRKSDSIRRRGENISSMEVEAEINAHPDVAESAVVGVPSEHGEQEVLAAVVLKPNSRLEPHQLIEFLRPRMPRFAIPRYIEIIDTLPKTSTQKIQKNLIRARGVRSSTWDGSSTARPSR